MPFYTYILRSEQDNRFYFGQTQDLLKRLEYHNGGKSRYTKIYMPWQLIAYKLLDSRTEAIKYEKMLKNLHGQLKVINFIKNHDFITEIEMK